MRLLALSIMFGLTCFAQTVAKIVPADATGTPVFSSTGKTVAYTAKKEGKCFVVINETPQAAFEDVMDPVVAEDGSVAYGAKRDGKWLMVASGKQSPDYELVGMPVYAPDGKSLAYSAKLNGKWFMVLDGKMEKEGFDSVWTPVFFSNSGSIVYRANNGLVVKPEGKESVVASGKWFVVAGGEKHGPYDWAQNPVVNADGNTFAFVAGNGGHIKTFTGRGGSFSWNYEGGNWFVFKSLSPQSRALMEHEYGKFAHIQGEPVLNANGRKVAFTAARDGKWVVMNEEKAVVEIGKFGPGGNMGDTPAISADGADIAFRIHGDGGWDVYRNDQKVGTYKWAGNPRISQDGKAVAFWAADKGDEAYVVFGDKKTESFSWNNGEWDQEVQTLTFTSITQHVVYRARIGKEWVIGIGREVGDRFDWVSRPFVSRDGKTVSYGARKGNDIIWKSVSVK